MWLTDNPIEARELAHAPRADAPLDDVHAWWAYPRHRWVYNLGELYEANGRRWGPAGTRPATFPCLIRPVLNVSRIGGERRWDGSSIGSPLPGELWVPAEDGPGSLIDLAVEAGLVRAAFLAVRAHEHDPWTENAFVPGDPRLSPRPERFVEDHLDALTGVVSLLYRGGLLAGCHLRMSAVARARGAGFAYSAAQLYDEGRWHQPAAVAG